MMTLSDRQASDLLNAATRRFTSRGGVNSLFLETRNNKPWLVVESASPTHHTASSFAFQSRNRALRVPVAYRRGPGISCHELELAEGEDASEFLRFEGGVRIRANGHSGIGTLGGAFEYFRIKINVKRDKRLCEGDNVLVSKSTVFGNGRRGTIIEALNTSNNSWERIGKTTCSTKGKRGRVFELALASIDNPSHFDMRQIADRGKIVGVTAPRPNMTVYKYGAATGWTRGRVIGRTVWYAGHRAHYGWSVDGRDFTCPGDSGALVLTSAGSAGRFRVVGINYGGNSASCGSVTQGAFQGFDTKNSGSDPKTWVKIFK